MHRRTVSVLLLLPGVALLAGCGQKGPLVLPAKPVASAAASAAVSPAAQPAAAPPAIRPEPATTVAPAPSTSSG